MTTKYLYISGFFGLILGLFLLPSDTFACAPYQPCNVVGGTATPALTNNTNTFRPATTRAMPTAGRTFFSTTSTPFGSNTQIATIPQGNRGGNRGINPGLNFCPPYSPCNTAGGSPFRPTSFNYNPYNVNSFLNNTNWYNNRFGQGTSFTRGPGFVNSYIPRGSWNYTNVGRHHVTNLGSNGYYYSNWGKDFSFQIGL